MKIYNVGIHDREADKNDTVNLAVLETDAEKKSYDAGDYDALCELLRLIEVGASCFNHYCVDYDDT